LPPFSDEGISGSGGVLRDSGATAPGSLVHRAPTYADLIVTALRRYPDRVAFIQGETNFTYAAAADWITRLMSVFHHRGLRRGNGVAILSRNRAEAWFAQAAATLMGCRYTPLHALGSEDDHVFVCADAEVRLLVFDPAGFDERASRIIDRVTGIDVLGLGPGEVAPDLLLLAAETTPVALRAVPESDDICWVPYTGGTTGRPKGVVLPHRSLMHNAWLTLTEFEWPREIRFIACTPISHGAGPMIIPTLLRGGTVITIDRFDPEYFVSEVGRTRATASFIVPTMIYVLMDHPSFGPDQLQTLETLIYGGSPMAPARMEQALDAWGPVFNQLYGQAEAPNTATILRKYEHDLARPQLLSSCGRPMQSLEVEVHDPGDQQCPPGEIGEIVIRGPLVMDGYWKRPEQTAETLRNGWLHTGDLALCDEEGYLYIVDRAKDMIITGGFNVYPKEIEDVLSSHPKVAAAVVIGVPDPKWGEAVKAVVVLRPGAEVGAEELMGLVRERKGAVCTPKSVDFVDVIPLTAVGKPDKKVIRAPYWEGQVRGVS